MTNSEKSSYIRAAICLTRRPAKHGIAGARTLWDELQYIHIYQATYIHFVGAFLPWHRYYLAAHAALLRNECDYRGRMPFVLSPPILYPCYSLFLSPIGY